MPVDTTSAAGVRSLVKSSKQVVASNNSIGGTTTRITNPSAATQSYIAKNKKVMIPVLGKDGNTVENLINVDTTTTHPAASTGLIYCNTPIKVTTTDANGTPITMTYQGYYRSTAKTPDNLPNTKTFNPKGSSAVDKVAYPDPAEYSWNLPPHKWSRPLWKGKDPNFTPAGLPHSPGNDSYRRGRLWYYMGDPHAYVIDPKGNKIQNANRMFGFQFMFNPESFGTQTAVQMDATPNQADRFLSIAGAFPATETITFTVYLDRTNDFADLYSQIVTKRKNSDGKTISEIRVDDSLGVNSANTSFINASDINDAMAAIYKEGFNEKASDVKDKVADLLRRGTIADIEYLYKAINGAGPGGASSTSWVNGRGIPTSDIGWLMPTLLLIDVGPLSYQGYVTNLAVTHTGFTPNMVPIRSTVTISLNVLATAGLTSALAVKKGASTGGNN